MSQSKKSFSRVGRFKTGYNVAEVDTFLRRAQRAYSGEGAPMEVEEISSAAFSPQRGGYEVADVDAALDRLAAAFVHLTRAAVIEQSGEEAWLNQTYDAATALYPRLLRPAGERFRDAEGWGYRKEDVDKLLNRLAAYFNGSVKLTADQLRGASFPEAKDGKAYDEAIVDVYIERAVAVLVSVE